MTLRPRTINSRPLRIAMLSIHSSPIGPLGTQDTGGMSVYVRELARILGAHGHHIDIFTFVRGRVREMALYPNVRLIHLAQDLDHDLEKEQVPAYLQHIFELLESFRQANGLTYDLIHSHYWLSGVVGAMAQARWRCPHLTMFHTLGILKNSTTAAEHESDLRIAHERWIAKVADFIVVPTARERDNLLNHYRAPADRVGIIPCGVNLDFFKPMDRLVARDRLGIRPDADVVLFVGRFAPLKGLDRLIGAAARLTSNLPNLQLMIVGGDGRQAKTTQSFMRQAAGLNIQAHVAFQGRVDQADLPPYYSAADLLVVPSHYESFSLVVLEALACGTPVAATPVGIVEAVIQNGLNGAIIQNQGVEAIARGIWEILSQPAQARPSSRVIRATAQQYGWHKVAADITETYEGLLQDHDPDQAPAFYEGCGVFPG